MAKSAAKKAVKSAVKKSGEPHAPKEQKTPKPTTGQAPGSEPKTPVENPSGTSVDKPAASEAYPFELIDQIAECAHLRNADYCRSIGDDSQVNYGDAPEWQKLSACNGVKFIIENPDAGPSASHDSWLAEKEADGWVYGEVKDVEKKAHPCFVSYDQLPDEQKRKDYLFIETVKCALTGVGQGRSPAEACLIELEWFDDIADADVVVQPLLNIDLLSFSAASAHAAAGRIFQLLINDDKANPDFWVCEGSDLELGDMKAVLLDLAAYVCSRPECLQAETLWRVAADIADCDLDKERFGEIQAATRIAYMVFAQTAWKLPSLISDEQAKLQAILDAQERREPAQPKRRDSVFEGHGSVNEKHKLDAG